MRIAVFGGGGFIGHHLVEHLVQQGHEVVAVDLKYNEFASSSAQEFIIGDLRELDLVRSLAVRNFDQIYQLAADMGGAGYVFTGDHDADIMQNSARINLNVLECLKDSSTRVFYASSACIYPEEHQMDPHAPNCAESTAYPANPDSEYGWEKLFSERLYLSYARNYGVDVRIARLHNVFGPFGVFDGGREKAPAAICRKVIRAEENGQLEIWGDGGQTRSFLYIDAAIEGMLRIMNSKVTQVLNIGSTEMISINKLAELAISLSGKQLQIIHIEGPQGVRGRCSDNQLIMETLGWQPVYSFQEGLSMLYHWIQSEISS